MSQRREGLDGYRQLSYDLPSRGLQLVTPGLFVEKRFSPKVDNVRFYAGEVTNRPGLVELPSPFSADPAAASTLDNEPISGFGHRRPDGSFYSLVGTRTSIYYLDTATDNWDDATGIITFTGANGDPWSWASFDEDACFSNGLDKVHRWRSPTHDYGAGAGLIEEISASVPARYVTNFAGRLVLGYVVNSGTQADRVQWSNENDPTTWTGSDFTDTVDWPGPITGLATMGSRAYVFKRDFIIEMRETGLDAPTFDFRAVIIGEGAGSHHTIVPIGQYLYFMGRDDVFVFDGSQIQPIGEPIRADLTEALSRTAVRNAHAFHHEPKNEYWLCIPTANDTFPSIAYVFNYVEQTWTKHSFPATCSVLYKSEGVDDAIDSVPGDPDIDAMVRTFDSGVLGADIYLQLIGKDDKILYKIDDTIVTDDGAAVTASFDLADTDFGTASMWTTINRVIVVVRDRGATTTVTVNYSDDGGTTYELLGTAASTGSGGMERLYIPCRKTCIQGRIQLTWTTSLAIQRVVLEVIDREGSR